MGKKIGVKWRLSDTKPQHGKVVLITGANSGIGFEMALEFAGKGAEVVLACRNQAKATEAKKRILAEHPGANVRALDLDLADLNALKRAARTFMATTSHLDVLINNAGVMIPPKSTTADGFELQVGTNHLGHFAFTAHLLPHLDKADDPRIVTVSSIAHTMGRLNLQNMHGEGKRYDKWGQYGRSKLANLMFALELDRRLKAAGSRIVSLCGHPGYANTSLQRHSMMWRFFNNMALSAPRGAAPIVYAATEPDALNHPYWGPVGPLEAWGWTGRARMSKAAMNEEDAKRLWTWSEDQIGFAFDVPSMLAQS
jgi:NAD(P)-dependent dehydrogenase (short-subunit alcohol dehydrogenase family)